MAGRTSRGTERERHREKEIQTYPGTGWHNNYRDIERSRHSLLKAGRTSKGIERETDRKNKTNPATGWQDNQRDRDRDR